MNSGEIDEGGANKVAIDDINDGRQNQIVVRQVKYLNNIVEQDYRAIKRRTRPMLNFQSFRSARHILGGNFLLVLSEPHANSLRQLPRCTLTGCL